MRLARWYRDRFQDLLAWLFPVESFSIELGRVQLEERVQRRETMEREMSDSDAISCVARVRRRMTIGDDEWIPPMYGRAEALREWRRRHRSHQRVTRIEERREA
jgi:hypothetical protein